MPPPMVAALGGAIERTLSGALGGAMGCMGAGLGAPAAAPAPLQVRASPICRYIYICVCVYL